MATESKKKLALAIIDFLQKSCTDGTLGGDEKESIEVATQCIADAFKVDPEDQAAVNDALGGQSLLSIYNVFEQMKGKKAASKPAAAPTPAAGPKQPTDAEKAEADALKSKGNAAIQAKDYKAAVDFYSQALKIIPAHPVYLSNRAAAYSSLNDFDNAIKDAELAVDTDPTYSKAWSRLGHARFSKGDHRGAMEAYKAGIDAEGNGGTQLLKIGYETAKKKVEAEEALQSPRGGAAGAGADDFDLSSILNNPALANNPMLEAAKNIDPNELKNMMNNPMIQNMMNSMLGGGPNGGLDPSKLMAMAEKFLGGGGPGGPAGGR
ncbi:glutamine-rich cytoplasmic protein [Pyronema omphalodes]|nr:glutamine-rich cytoplasmic protein [Pyronema omphalodes]